MSKKTVYKIEALLLDALLGVFSVMKPKAASKLGGSLMAAIGPLFKAQNRRIMRHLTLAFPDEMPEELEHIRKEMWRDLGMIIGEYPHLERFVDGHPDFTLEITGTEHLDPVRDRPLLFVSGHIGNWEILPIVCKNLGVPFHPLYRAANNSYVDVRLAKMREAKGKLLKGFPKSRQGLRDMTETLRNGGRIGILVDQRHSGGPDVEFFGRKAQVATIAADLAQKYGATVMAGRIVRRGPCDFLFETRPPFDMTGKTPLEVMQEIYRQLEAWIKEHPEQWLWTHQRWGKNV